MTELSTELSPRKAKPIRTAVYQNKAVSKEGFSERLFALAFSGLVYPQIWEDPDIDMEAMHLGEGHRVVTIASGGCNILAYLTRSPATIDAVDLNKAHIALDRMKLAAYSNLPSHADLFRFFGETGNRHNGAAYDSSSHPISTTPRAAIGKSAAGAASAASPCSRRISIAPACSACSSASAISYRGSMASTRPT